MHPSLQQLKITVFLKDIGGYGGVATCVRHNITQTVLNAELLSG
jgi:hypothetical protein